MSTSSRRYATSPSSWATRCSQLDDHGSGRNPQCDAESPDSSTYGKGFNGKLVKHRGTVLGLRDRHGYRRPRVGQAVWRKKETVIQERVVHYTTLDEEGKVRKRMVGEKGGFIMVFVLIEPLRDI